MKQHLERLFLNALLVSIVSACHFLAGPEGAQPEEVTEFTPTLAATSLIAATSTLTPSSTAIASPTNTLVPYTLKLEEANTDVEYQIPLTLQYVNPTSATFSFELSNPHEGSLFLWNTMGPVEERPFSSNETAFTFTFHGLQPGGEYMAAVGLRDLLGGYSTLLYQEREWGMVQFRTLPAQQSPVRVAVLGDSGFGEQTTYRLIERIATYDPDFVIHTGDVVYNIQEDADAPAAYAKKFYWPFAPLLHRIPVYPVVGNHDVAWASLWEGVPFYYHAFPQLEVLDEGMQGSEERREWYALSVAGYQILLLNSQSFFGAGGYQEQTQWLKERLADERYLTTIPVFHVAPYTSGLHGGDGISIQRNWGPLFQQAGIPLVISGHDHNYERLVVDGMTYIVSGGGSGVLYGQRAFEPISKTFARRTHFVLLELFSDHIELTSVALEGETLDQTTIPLGPE